MQPPFLRLTYTLDEIKKAAEQFWESVHPYTLFAFNGDMGAGKTTFIHTLCDHLHVTDAVSSPTFALINEYHFTDSKGADNTIYHMDWYRINSMTEAMDAGMEDCIAQTRRKNTYCFIEWPERAAELLTAPYLAIQIITRSVTEREMTVSLIN